MEKTELHPQIFLIEDFLTPQECDYYIELANGEVFRRSQNKCARSSTDE